MSSRTITSTVPIFAPTVASNSKTIRILSFLTLLFVLFPYVALIRTQSDTQPYALGFSCILLLVMFVRNGCDIELTRPIVLLGIVAAYALMLSFVYQDFGVRSLAGYVSAFVITWVAYLIHRRGLLKVSLIKWALWMWTAVGVIQLFSPYFGQWLLPDMRISDGRGVLSLAPEPSYYGTFCVFVFILVRLLRAKGYVDKTFCRSCDYLVLFQIVILARSALCVLMLLVYVVINQVVNFRLKNLLVAAVLIAVGSPAMFYFFPDSRMVSLAKLLWEDPQLFYITDASINDRVSHIFISTSAFINSLPFAIGHGTNSWGDYLFRNARNFPQFPYMYNSDRIMSAYGGALFELGYVGLIIPIVVLYSFLSQQKKQMKIVGMFFWICMVEAVPLAFPLFGFILGVSEAMRVQRECRTQVPDQIQKARRLLPCFRLLSSTRLNSNRNPAVPVTHVTT